MRDNNFIKSPLNYTGGKYKLLPQILPLFPENIETFVDLMCGGCNVGVNVSAKSVICNDTEEVVINLLNSWKGKKPEDILQVLDATIAEYSLSKEDSTGYYKLRDDYNNGKKDWNYFYAMLLYAFNYQIRFNKQGMYNMPSGTSRSSFNPSLREKLIAFINRINSLDIEFTSLDFRRFPYESLDKNDFVYCDPPYLITCASYNEQDKWNLELEMFLYKVLDDLSAKGIKWAMNNVIENKGKRNSLLENWIYRGVYTIHTLDNNYDNCSYHNLQTGTHEVLITNY